MDLVERLRAAGCVFAEDEAALLLAESDGDGQLEGWVARRVAGEPLEHLLGWAEFAGHRMVVAPGVFVPRRRTEMLAREAVEAARQGERPVVVELCCGVAAAATVVAREVPGAVVYAVDDDPAAVACAEANLGADGTVLLGDLADPLPAELRGRVSVLVANPPHVPTDEIALMPSEAREHEARSALDGGPDGTTVLRRVVAVARDWLAPDGVLLLEAGREQAALLAREVAELLATDPNETDPNETGPDETDPAGPAGPAGPARHTRPTGVRVDDAIAGTLLWVGPIRP